MQRQLVSLRMDDPQARAHRIVPIAALAMTLALPLAAAEPAAPLADWFRTAVPGVAEGPLTVERIAAADILADIDAVLQRITLAMRERIAERKAKAREHAAANPNQHYSRPKRRD